MITASVEKPQKPLSRCSLPPALCELNDKFLVGDDIIRQYFDWINL